MSRALKLAKYAGVSAIILGLGDECIYDVDAGTRAVMFNKLNGIDNKVIGEGTHLKIPFLENPYILDIRARPRVIHSATGTKDLQMVNISLRVLSRPMEEHLPTIYKNLGTDFDDRVLPSLGNEVLKAVVAQYNAEELLSKRASVSEQIKRSIIDRATKFNLVVDDVSITHLTFGKEFSRAIENKQVAQQEAETQAYVVQKSDQERKASIIRAEGEAEAATLISSAMTAAGNGLIEVRRIDAAREVAATLSRSPGVVYLPNGKDGSNLLLNVKQ